MPPRQNPFGPLLVALVTPFTPDGDVAWADLARQADTVVTGGADGVVVCGTTGEAPSLADDEKIRLVEHVAETVAGRATVVAGGGSSSTARAVSHYRACEAAGADGIMVAAPAYVRPSQQGILAHLRAVSDATSLPVMVYDVPARTGVRIDLTTLLLASQHPSVRAVKDADGDLARAARLVATSELLYFAGSDATALPAHRAAVQRPQRARTASGRHQARPARPRPSHQPTGAPALGRPRPPRRDVHPA
jgi:4-hydroxy-tetrahydrodipicolinate synthase